jgi:hypothetical protein
MKFKLPKIDPSLLTEIAGASLVTFGILQFSLPIACIVLGSFLIWITEKAE